jgi:hypothetical protein
LADGKNHDPQVSQKPGIIEWRSSVQYNSFERVC